MHIAMPHDTRRGSSQYRSAPGYAEADSQVDRHERERALAVVRARENRERDRQSGVPSAHALNAMLADAVALCMDPTTGDPAVVRSLARTVRRVLLAKGFDLANEQVQRRIEIRIRPPERIIEAEMTARIARSVEARMEQRRREAAQQSIFDLYAELPDDRDD